MSEYFLNASYCFSGHVFVKVNTILDKFLKLLCCGFLEMFKLCFDFLFVYPCKKQKYCNRVLVFFLVNNFVNRMVKTRNNKFGFSSYIVQISLRL